MVTELGALFDAVDLLSVFFGALAGGLIARQQPDYDITGVLGLALVSGIGGGILRDLLVAEGPPLPIIHWQYLLLCLLGGALAFLAGLRLRPLLTGRASTLINALAFGSFTVAAALRGLGAGFGVLATLFLCVVGSSTGGLVRDVLLDRPPDLFRKGQLMAVAAVAGGGALLLCDAAGLSRPGASVIGAAVATAVRLLAIRFNIETPVPPERQQATGNRQQ